MQSKSSKGECSEWDIHLVRDQLHSVYLNWLEKKQDGKGEPIEDPSYGNTDRLCRLAWQHIVANSRVVDKEIHLFYFTVLSLYLFVLVQTQSKLTPCVCNRGNATSMSLWDVCVSLWHLVPIVVPPHDAVCCVDTEWIQCPASWCWPT